MDARATIVGVLPLTLGASCAALWAWQHPERHQERRKGGTPEPQEESAVQENGELREKLEEVAREHGEALRQVEALRGQLEAAENGQDRERRQGERLAAQLELQLQLEDICAVSDCDGTVYLPLALYIHAHI